jgi:hypothetical protein
MILTLLWKSERLNKVGLFYSTACESIALRAVRTVADKNASGAFLKRFYGDRFELLNNSKCTENSDNLIPNQMIFLILRGSSELRSTDIL